ncbi:GNAT family N-acetyltransferase [Parasphingorhabdus sp.]|uniref:GNAT family N-acetyltransferase n=1 Tax=Parasphingorhabdus sp. TaxID=2709688 RepID=UPI003A903459
MRFVRAELGDIAALHPLIESAYRGESARRGWTHEADLLDGQRTDPEALREIILADNQVILLARDEENIAGCVQLTRLVNRLAYLGLLTVDPDRQASGLGRQLLVQSERFVREQWQAAAIEMTVIRQRTDLIAYYERRGYMRTGEHRPFPHGDPRFGLPKSTELEFAVLRKPV